MRLQANEDLRTLELLIVPHSDDANSAYHETKNYLETLANTGRSPNKVISPADARRKMKLMDSEVNRGGR